MTPPSQPAHDGWSLRPATEDDTAALAQMDGRYGPAPWSREQFAKELEKPFARVWVLTDDETDEVRAGFIVFWILMEECQIQNLAIDLPHRGLGLAQKMIRAAIREAMTKGCARAVLEVRRPNLPAIQLYQKLGFGIVAVRKRFYSNGDDAYQMSLTLTGDAAPELSDF